MSAPPISAVRVIVTGRGQPPHELHCSRFPIRMGRNPLNELPLADPHVSQWHAIVGQVDGTLRIIDVGSRNGTLINGRRLTGGEAVPLAGGESIEIGPFTIRVERAETTSPSRAQPAAAGAPPVATAAVMRTIAYD